MKNTQTHLFNLKLKRNFNLFSHSLFFFTFSSFKVGFSTGKIKENIIPEKYCNNNSWSAKFRNYKLRDSRTSAKHIGKWNSREFVGFTPRVYAAFLTIKFRALEEQIFQKYLPFYLLTNLKKVYKTKRYPVSVSDGVWKISSISSASSSCSPIAPSKTPNCVTSPSVLAVV